MSEARRETQAVWVNRWLGGVLVLCFALIPLAGWLGPLAFAPIMAGIGLMCLPALRVEEGDRPLALALTVAVIWAVGSTLWSPFEIKDPWTSNPAKLVSQALLYWAAYCAVARLERPALRLAMSVFMWGVSALSVLIIAEAVTGAALYQWVRQAIGDPIRPDLAVRNTAQGVFVLAVLWGPAALAAFRLGWWQLSVLMAAAILAGGFGLAADAPVLALVAAGLAGVAVWFWPKLAPRVLAAAAGLLFLLTPLAVWAAREQGIYGRIQERVSLSWSMRMDYWSFAIDWIGDKPLRGWGLDASRMFGPGIKLHPHNGPLQIWLELGVIGVAAAVILWAGLFLKLERRTPDLGASAGAAAAVSYLTFATVSFGVWQEWWLALGALAVVAAASVQRLASRAAEAGRRQTAVRSPSTSPRLSE